MDLVPPLDCQFLKSRDCVFCLHISGTLQHMAYSKNVINKYSVTARAVVPRCLIWPSLELYSLFPHRVCTWYVCVGVHTLVHMWGSADNFEGSVFSFCSKWVPGIELWFSGLHSKHLYPLSHLASPNLLRLWHDIVLHNCI